MSFGSVPVPQFPPLAERQGRIPDPPTIHDREAFLLPAYPERRFLLLQLIGFLFFCVPDQLSLGELIAETVIQKSIKVLRGIVLVTAVVSDHAPAVDIAVFIKSYFHSDLLS